MASVASTMTWLVLKTNDSCLKLILLVLKTILLTLKDDPVGPQIGRVGLEDDLDEFGRLPGQLVVLDDNLEGLDDLVGPKDDIVGLEDHIVGLENDLVVLNMALLLWKITSLIGKSTLWVLKMTLLSLIRTADMGELR